MAKAGRLFDEANAHRRAAAAQYQGAYECWQAFCNLLGHGAAERARRMPARRAAGAAAVRAWLAHERAGLGEVEQALALLD